MNVMTVLIVNANGKISSLVTQALLTRGVPVRAMARRIALAQARFPAAQIRGWGPAGVTALVPDMLTGISAIFCALPTLSLVGLIDDLVGLACTAGVQRFVAVVPCSNRADRLVSEAALRDLLERSGLDWTILRAGFAMQNYLDPHGDTIRRTSAFFEPADVERVAALDHRDLADIACRILCGDIQAGGTSLDLTGPEMLSRQMIADHLSRVTGRTIQFFRIDERLLATVLIGQASEHIELLTQLYALSRHPPPEMGETVAALLGRPPGDFARFADDHAEYWRHP